MTNGLCAPVTDIQALLDSKDNSHGDFKVASAFIQRLKAVFHAAQGWADLSAAQKESIEMACTKYGRILYGDQNFKDSWDDLAGYATLISNMLKG